MVILAGASFHPLDWGVLGAYVLVLIVTGILFSRRKPTGVKDYFLGARAMPVWAVAISILATAQSAATFVGVPEQAYAGDLTYLSTNIGGLLAAVLLATVFIPAFYRLGVATPYQLLGARFGPGAMLATSWAYMVGRVFASGARVYIGALPVSLAVFGDTSTPHITLAIAVFMVVGILYTLVGGISSVIWTDVIQVGVYLGAAVVALVVLLDAIPADFGSILQSLRSPAPGAPSKLTLVQVGGDPWKPFTLLTAISAFTLIAIASHGTDQDLVQRMLTCKSATKGGWSVISGVLIGIPSVALFSLIGLLLFVFYRQPELMGRPAPAYAAGDSADIFLKFILNEMPPGVRGLMIAGVLAAGPAGINASLNAMASTFVSDVYTPARRAGGRGEPSERHMLRVARGAVVGWGVVLGLFAVLCVFWRRSSDLNLINFALSVMTFAYAGLLGVFLTALFTRRGNSTSAVLALIAGFETVALLQPVVWVHWTGLTPWTAPWIYERLAWPWHLVIGAAVATTVCCLGTPRRDRTLGPSLMASGTPAPLCPDG